MNEFVKRGEFVHTMFESLAPKMNSAQNMNPAIGYNATLTFITYPKKGGKVQPARIQEGFHSICYIKRKIVWYRLITVMNYVVRVSS